eukprot:CAMPEP_0119353932 /NCGR_PEP_ID=MMETSP1334-20130426/3019_1 /TAXON_ID=127549 /ORGANISM="Calcidiscus leptoporus, Strain RCC1130" /LENGTH=84 /DNA_ID=CAMNT_0007367351 /DNA_START=382 /DNA_END=633 /DNA_ORIENTATION=+
MCADVGSTCPPSSLISVKRHTLPPVSKQAVASRSVRKTDRSIVVSGAGPIAATCCSAAGKSTRAVVTHSRAPPSPSAASRGADT